MVSSLTVAVVPSDRLTVWPVVEVIAKLPVSCASPPTVIVNRPEAWNSVPSEPSRASVTCCVVPPVGTLSDSGLARKSATTWPADAELYDTATLLALSVMLPRPAVVMLAAVADNAVHLPGPLVALNAPSAKLTLLAPRPTNDDVPTPVPICADRPTPPTRNWLTACVAPPARCSVPLPHCTSTLPLAWKNVPSAPGLSAIVTVNSFTFGML